MAKKKYYKKKAVLKAIAKYYRVTVSKVITLEVTQNGVSLNGNSSAYPLSEIFTGTSTFQELGKQFTFVKIRGVYIEVAPIHNANAQGGICLAVEQANEANNNTVWSQPNVMLASDLQITRKYIPIRGTWEPTNAQSTLANLKLAYQVVKTFNSEKAWSILIKTYLTFKTSI